MKLPSGQNENALPLFRRGDAAKASTNSAKQMRRADILVRSKVMRLEDVCFGGSVGRCVSCCGQECPRAGPPEKPPMNLPQKAGASSTHSKRCRAVSTSRRFAKRLECVRLAGAFGSWPRCAVVKPWRLLMNERPLTLILSPDGGEEIHSRFMAPMCVRLLEVEPPHNGNYSVGKWYRAFHRLHFKFVCRGLPFDELHV